MREITATFKSIDGVAEARADLGFGATGTSVPFRFQSCRCRTNAVNCCQALFRSASRYDLFRLGLQTSYFSVLPYTHGPNQIFVRKSGAENQYQGLAFLSAV